MLTIMFSVLFSMFPIILLISALDIPMPTVRLNLSPQTYQSNINFNATCTIDRLPVAYQLLRVSFHASEKLGEYRRSNESDDGSEWRWHTISLIRQLNLYGEAEFVNFPHFTVTVQPVADFESLNFAYRCSIEIVRLPPHQTSRALFVSNYRHWYSGMKSFATPEQERKYHENLNQQTRLPTSNGRHDSSGTCPRQKSSPKPEPRPNHRDCFVLLAIVWSLLALYWWFPAFVVRAGRQLIEYLFMAVLAFIVVYYLAVGYFGYIHHDIG